jgi:hypothetical protein
VCCPELFTIIGDPRDFSGAGIEPEYPVGLPLKEHISQDRE